MDDLLNMKDFAKKYLNQSGIYQIINIFNNKSYIGSSINLGKRFTKCHIYKLNHNKHCTKLQNDFNLHGEYFRVKILENCQEFQLLEKERYYIELLKPEYNTIVYHKLDVVKNINEDYFYLNTKKNNDCIEYKNGDEYGRISKHKKSISAHIISFFLYNSYLPIGIVRHLCNNKKCVNPLHLKDGSHSENYKDRKLGKFNNIEIEFIRQNKKELTGKDLQDLFFQKFNKTITLGYIYSVWNNSLKFDNNYKYINKKNKITNTHKEWIKKQTKLSNNEIVNLFKKKFNFSINIFTVIKIKRNKYGKSIYAN